MRRHCSVTGAPHSTGFISICCYLAATQVPPEATKQLLDRIFLRLICLMAGSSTSREWPSGMPQGMCKCVFSLVLWSL